MTNSNNIPYDQLPFKHSELTFFRYSDIKKAAVGKTGKTVTSQEMRLAFNFELGHDGAFGYIHHTLTLEVLLTPYDWQLSRHLTTHHIATSLNPAPHCGPFPCAPQLSCSSSHLWLLAHSCIQSSSKTLLDKQITPERLPILRTLVLKREILRWQSQGHSGL